MKALQLAIIAVFVSGCGHTAIIIRSYSREVSSFGGRRVGIERFTVYRGISKGLNRGVQYIVCWNRGASL